MLNLYIQKRFPINEEKHRYILENLKTWKTYSFFSAHFQTCHCRNKILVVLVMNLTCTCKVDFDTDNQRRIRHPFKHLTWSTLTKIYSSYFRFYKNNLS